MRCMLFLAGQTEPSPGPFLLIWGILALIGGVALATKKGSARFQALVASGFAQSSQRQAAVRTVRPGFLRFLGSLFALGGMVALPIAITMIVRS